MKNKNNDQQNDSFDFASPGMRSAAGGAIFWLTSLLIFWVPTLYLCHAIDQSDPFYFMLLSYIIGVPVGVWLYQQPTDYSTAVPNDRSSNVVNFMTYVNKKRTADKKTDDKTDDKKADDERTAA